MSAQRLLLVFTVTVVLSAPIAGQQGTSEVRSRTAFNAVKNPSSMRST